MQSSLEHLKTIVYAKFGGKQSALWGLRKLENNLSSALYRTMPFVSSSITDLQYSVSFLPNGQK